MAPWALPHPGRVPEIETSIPQNSSVVAAELQNSSGNFAIPLGFSVGRLLIGEGASSGVDQDGHAMGGCGQVLGHASLLCGQPLTPLRLPFGPRPSSGKNRSSRTCFVQF
jgi:hypothetical protein